MPKKPRGRWDNIATGTVMFGGLGSMAFGVPVGTVGGAAAGLGLGVAHDVFDLDMQALWRDSE